MEIEEIRKLIIERLQHLYDGSECGAIADYYINEKSGLSSNYKKHVAELVKIDINHSDLMNDVEKLAKGMPVQYVTGVSWFFGKAFYVNNHVLIPRPETEELLDLILKDNVDLMPGSLVLDIGTGSGCIAITFKMNSAECIVYGTDISPEAITVAMKNSEIHHCNVNYIIDNILESRIPPHLKFDIIISNPPYIPINHAGEMDKNVVNFEPAIALFTPENQPLVYYKAILNFSENHLNPGGKIYFEIHHDQGESILNYAGHNPHYKVELLKDISGNDRFIKIVRKI